METTRFVEIKTPCVSQEEAKKIALSVLNNRLASSARIVPMKSIYWWENVLHEGDEFLLVFYTAAENYPSIVEKIRALHSYEAPSIVAVEIIKSPDEFKIWVSETANIPLAESDLSF